MNILDNLVEKSLDGDYEALKKLLMLLTDYIPPGIDNMVLLYEEGDRTIYLSSEGVKSVMVGRGEFLPFIESHMTTIPIERLKDNILEGVKNSLDRILRDIYEILVKWMDHGLEDHPLYDYIPKYIDWYRKRFRGDI